MPREPPGDEIPNSPYSAAKWATSMYGSLFHHIYQLPVVVARPFVGYGPNQPGDKLIPFVIRLLMNEKEPQLSNGLWKIDWIYIDDMVEGILRCGALPGLEGRAPACPFTCPRAPGSGSPLLLLAGRRAHPPRAAGYPLRSLTQKNNREKISPKK